jgi:superfamily II DNA or RNA helicase
VPPATKRIAAPVPIPHLRLFTERVSTETPSPPSVAATPASRSRPSAVPVAIEDEFTLPALCLSFDYAGTRIPASDPRQSFFVSEATGVASVSRDAELEAAARAELERFGAVELDCLEGYEASFGSPANYLVAVDGDAHAYCAFSAQALPALRARGFVVEVDDDYPYQVLEEQAPWFLAVQPLAERPDWFNCELGVEVEGQRVNLLNALIEWLDALPGNENLERLNNNSQKFWALPLDDRRFLRVPSDLLSEILSVLRELYSGRSRSMPIAISRYQAASVEALANALTRRQKTPKRYGPRLLDDALAKQLSVVPTDLEEQALPEPEGLKATLRPYQALGVRWLQALRAARVSGVLADDMGLGKTLQVIAHLCVEHARTDVHKPTLVVLPTSLVQNWRRELARFAPGIRVGIWYGNERHREDFSRAQVIITTYSLLVRDEARWIAGDYHYLILDEAQAIKNPRAAARDVARRIPADHRLCLSGTPVENHLGDLWSLFDFLMPGLLGSAGEFQTGYRVPIEHEQNEGQLDTLRRVVGPYILRRTKEEVTPELPPKSVLVRLVQLEGEQRRLYEAIRVAAHADVRRVIRNKGMSGSTIAILDALMKLRQVCCDPRLVNFEAARRVQASAKLTFFFQLLGQQLAERRRVLVFSQFKSMLELIGAGLEDRKIDYLMLTGATADRQREVDAFERGDADVFLISLKAGGTGLNLTSADTVIHYDPWWNPAAQAQATDRAHRIGQTRPVFVHQLIVAGSVEERMLELQRHKQELATGLCSGAGGARLALSESELSDLFAPLPGADG